MDENKGVPPVYTPPQEAYPPGYQPPQQGYPPPQQGYPPPQQGYPPPQQGYPPPQQGYPPPQQGYPPQQAYPPQGYPPQQGTANVVVIQQPAAQPVRFGALPVTITDSNGQQVTTRLEYRAGTLTWLICCAVCWLTGCWCFALIPCCIDGAKDVYHYSPTDNKLVGVYKRI